MLGDQDTITALATAKNVVAALSVIRISGNKTPEILEKCFSSKKLNPQDEGRFYFGTWKNPINNDSIDEVVVLSYPSGTGYTGEQAAEIICHGNNIICDEIIESILNSGARMARPGEFSYRAVLNNKINLSQAEAVLEIIHAKSPLKAKQALQNIKGVLSKKIAEIEGGITHILANLEASIDFTTEDIQPVSLIEAAYKILAIKKEMEELINGYQKNIKAENGIRAAIIGKPNVGKSSLLNTLCGKDKSIVTPIAGTTRDVVEQEMFFSDVLVVLSDTAGLRESEDEIEIIGMSKTKEVLDQADIVIYVLDSEQGISKVEATEIKNINNKEVILCFNKADLYSGPLSTDLLDITKYKNARTTSNKAGGANELKVQIENSVRNLAGIENLSPVSNKRQFKSLSNAIGILEDANKMLLNEESPDLVSFVLKNALLEVKSISNKEMGDEILDTIFKEFCIGK